MERSDNPNEVMTPVFVGERLVFLPASIAYLGSSAIRKYMEDHPDGTSETTNAT